MAGSTNIRGITIEFGGDVTPLQKALRELRKDTKGLDNELKDVNKALKLDPKNVDLIRQKQQLLKDDIKKTTANVEELKQKQKEMADAGLDRTSEQYRLIEREVATTEARVKELNTELKKTGNAKFTALAQSMEEIGKKAVSAGKKLTTHVTAPIVAAYGLAANLGSDYEENLNKIDVAFGDSAEAVKDWATTAREQFGLSQVQATSAASSFGALGKGIGLSESEAANMATTLTGLSADLGSYFNVGTDESAKALEGIFTGESEALKKFGVVMNDTNLAQFAADQGLVWSELDQTEKTMVRYQFVLAKTQDAQGDFARTSDGTANSTKIFKATLQDLGTAIGTQLLPIITPIIQKVTEFLGKLAEASPETLRIITIIGLVVAAVGPLLVVVGQVMTGIAAIKTAITGLSTAMTFLSGGPIAIIIAAIVGLIAFIVLLVKHWDTIKAKALEVWESIKEVYNGVADWFRAKFEAAYEAIKGVFSSVAEFFGGIWETIKSRFTDLAVSVGDAISGAVRSGINGVISMIENTINGAIRLINGAIGLINKIPGVSIGTLGELSLPRLAKGGVLYGAQTVIAGEAGPEAIIPLDKLFRQMDKMAETIAGTGGGGVTVNVYATPGMDVNALAREIERRIIETQNRRRLAWQ